jgi:hypothetical protein
MLANDEILATYLSRNHSIPHYAETDGEKVLMLLRQFISITNSGNAQAGYDFAKNIMAKKIPLGALLLCEETRDYVLTLYELADHFYSSPCTTGQWMKSHMTDVYGGVRFFYVIPNNWY